MPSLGNLLKRSASSRRAAHGGAEDKTNGSSHAKNPSDAATNGAPNGRPTSRRFSSSPVALLKRRQSARTTPNKAAEPQTSTNDAPSATQSTGKDARPQPTQPDDPKHLDSVQTGVTNGKEMVLSPGKTTSDSPVALLSAESHPSNGRPLNVANESHHHDHLERASTAPPIATLPSSEARHHPAASYANGYVSMDDQQIDISKYPRLKRRIIVLCDGTWKDGTQNGASVVTNVLRFARSIFPEDRRFFPPIPQMVCYLPGVGTTDDFLVNAQQGATGQGVIAKIREAYTFISANWIPGDEIFLIGFSRGAYTARTIGALICDLGVLARPAMEHFYEIFEAYQDRKDPDKLEAAEKVLAEYKRGGVKNPVSDDEGPFIVKAIGVFDTVGAYGVPGFFSPDDTELLGFMDDKLGKRVQYGFHAMAINETRNDFTETKWVQSESARARGQIMKQTWFAGSHSDVGGGYAGHDLADLTLVWMASNFELFNLLSFDWDYIWSIPHPHASWGKLKPHNPRKKGIMALSFPTKRKLPTKPDDSTQERFHSSVVQQAPCSQEILETLKKHPDMLEPLMPREEELKQRWGTGKISHSLDDMGHGGMLGALFDKLKDKIEEHDSDSDAELSDSSRERRDDDAAIMGKLQTERSRHYSRSRKTSRTKK